MRPAILALLVLAAGCYQIDADVSGLSASAGVQTFAGAGAAAGQLVQIDRMWTLEGGSALASTLRAARIDSVTLTPGPGVGSLAFLSSLTLVVHAPTGDIPLVDASGQMAAADGSVELPIAVDIDPALLAAPLPVAAGLGLVAPAGGWSMRVDAKLTVHGHADVKP